MTECKQETLRFQEISGKQIEAKFDGGWSNDPQEALQEARDISRDLRTTLPGFTCFSYAKREKSR